MQPKALPSHPLGDVTVSPAAAYLRVGKVMAYSEHDEVGPTSAHYGIFHVIVTCNRSDGAQHLLHHILRSARKKEKKSLESRIKKFHRLLKATQNIPQQLHLNSCNSQQHYSHILTCQVHLLVRHNNKEFVSWQRFSKFKE